MVFDKVISFFDNDDNKNDKNKSNQFNKVCVDESVIDSIVFYSKKSYPNEFLAMFDGYIEDNTLFIDTLIFLPGDRSHTGASFNDWLLPPGQNKYGSVHSHPGYNSAYPSNADLVTFSKYGYFHIIVCEPYSLETMNAYDNYGNPTTFEVANFKREENDLMMNDLAEIKKELEMEDSLNKSSSEDIFTKINKAFAEDSDDFYDNFDDELEKVNKYSHEFENNSNLENIKVPNPQNIKIQIIINKNDLDKKE